MVRNVPRSKPSIARSNGIEIAYETFGDPSEPPLVLIMGLGYQMVFWDKEFCIQLSRQGYQVKRI